MASFIFEEGTQAQASGFKSGETLIFKTATPATLNVTYTAASGLNTDFYTLTFGDTTLQFAASALSGGTKQFLAGGTLILGTSGPDTAGLSAVSGADAVAAYLIAGDDVNATVTGAGGHIVDLGAGNDSITATGTADGAYYLLGGSGDDTIDASGTSGNLHVYGNVVGAAGLTDGNDVITLGTGNSYVNGNAGNDTITATVGANRILGGAGNDSITGGSGNDSINGNAGNDTIIGGAGNDLLRGGQGDDSIVSGTGNNQLFGDLGNDTLTGNTGVDVFTGGAGNDVFIFAAGDAPIQAAPLAGFFDEITDFTTGSDKIDLALVVTGTTAANLVLPAGATFTTEAAARIQAQQLLDGTTAPAATHNVALVQVGSDTYLYSHEGAGAGTTIDTIIKLDGVTAADVKAADFV